MSDFDHSSNEFNKIQNAAEYAVEKVSDDILKDDVRIATECYAIANDPNKKIEVTTEQIVNFLTKIYQEIAKRKKVKQETFKDIINSKNMTEAAIKLWSQVKDKLSKEDAEVLLVEEKKIIVCESCNSEINYLAEKEYAMGAIACPNCKSIIDQYGSLLNKRYDSIAPDKLERLTDTELEAAHKEAHEIWQLYEVGKFKDLELLVNNHILIVQEMLRRKIKHEHSDKLDDESLEFKRDYDKDGKELLFKHEELHSFSNLEDYDNFYDFQTVLEKHNNITDLLKNFGIEHKSKEDFLDDYFEFIKRSNNLAAVHPSGEHNKHRETIKLDEVLPYFKSFKLRSPFIFLTGGVCNNEKTTNDIDILINCTQAELDKTPLFQMLTWRLMRSLPRRYWGKIQFLPNNWQGPVTNNIPLYELACLRTNLDNKIFQMSYQDSDEEFAKALVRTKNSQAEKQAQKAKKNDAITLGEFFLPLKPTRGAFVNERMTVDSFMSLFKDEDFPVYNSTKRDGFNNILIKDNAEITIFSEDGEDVTKRFPTLCEEIRKLNAEQVVLLAEIEMWIDKVHQPREAVSGYAHMKSAADDAAIVANVYDCVFYNKDIHNLNFIIRKQYLDKLNIKQSVNTNPNTEIKLNKIPHYICKNKEELRKTTEKLREIPSSEGVVAKMADAKYNLAGKRSGMIKLHNNAAINVIVLDKQKTANVGIYNYLYGVELENEKVSEARVKKIGSTRYLLLGKTFSTSADLKIGDKFVLEFETLNIEYHEKTDEIKLTCFVPRFIQETNEAVDTIKSIITAAKNENHVLQEKDILETGEVIYKSLDFEKQDPYEIIPEEGESYKYSVQHHYRGKSVSDLTPIIIHREGNIEVLPIGQLFTRNDVDEFPIENIKVWGDNRWEKIKWIMRHTIDEPICRINTFSGVIETTKDHSLFDKAGKIIKASDLTVGLSIKLIDELPKLDEEFEVSEDFAWILGFFLAEGSWSFSRQSAKFAQKHPMYFEIIEKFAKSHGLYFYKYKDKKRDQWSCHLKGMKTFTNFYGYTPNFYTGRKARLKIIPSFVFKWNNEAKMKFIKGFLDGDGEHIKRDPNCIHFSSCSQALLQGIYLLYNTLMPENKEITLGLQENMFRAKIIDGNHEKTEKDRGLIKEILFSKSNLGYGENNSNFRHGRYIEKNRLIFPQEFIYSFKRYVYDIETESHSFLGGIGRILAHNSCHSDLRMESKDKKFLVGWTCMDLLPNKITEPILTLKDAAKANTEDNFKIEWTKKPAKVKMRRTASGNIVPAEIRAATKAAEPSAWLDVEGVTERGSVGATKEFPGVFSIIDKGTVEYGATKPYFKELFFGKQGKLQGRWIFRQISEYRKDERMKGVLPASLPSERPETSGFFWVLIQPIDQAPYVLSDRAIAKNWIAPFNYSSLPFELRKNVPAEFQYWKNKKESDRIRIRNEYVQWLKENKKYDELKKCGCGVEISAQERPRIDEVAILSSYLSCDVKDIFPKSISIPKVRAGNYFDSLIENTKNFTLVEIRNFASCEIPPCYEEIQLKKNLSKTFLTEGFYFFHDEEKQIPFVLQVSQTWGGYVVKIISRIKDKENNLELSQKIEQFAKDNNLLKGEKFTISGEFIDTHALSFDDLKLSMPLKERLKRLMYLIENTDTDLASRGLLFLGPPGCGKTLTGKILSNSTPTFIWITSKDFAYTSTLGAISTAFSLARELSPTIIFMEDIDSYVDREVVDLLKTELDGLQLNKGIFTVLTSNFPEKLPEALIDRPGRFHDVLYFSLPNEEIRNGMFSHFLKNEEYDSEVLEVLIRKTNGFSGAHIKEICDFAKIIKREDSCTLARALITSLDKVIEQRKLVMSFKNKNEDISSLNLFSHDDLDVDKSIGTFKFVLQHHSFKRWNWTENKPVVVIRSGASEEHWDLRIDTGKLPIMHWVLDNDPGEVQSTTALYKPCNDKSSMDKGKENEDKDYLKPGTSEWSPTKDTRAWLDLEDSGEVIITIDKAAFKRIQLDGKKLKGLYTLTREDEKSDFWVLSKAKLPETTKKI